jgi:hypothetical protein
MYAYGAEIAPGKQLDVQNVSRIFEIAYAKAEMLKECMLALVANIGALNDIDPDKWHF